MNLFEKVFRELNKKKIKYLVVGGVAVNLYGYSRFTGDIDILVALSPDNLKKIDRIMKEMGYVERLPISITVLGDKKKLENFMKKKSLKAYTYISSHNPQLDIDIIVGESLRFDNFKENETIIKVWNIQLPVISIDDLIKMKKRAGRDNDLLDLKALLEIKNL